MGSKHKDLSDLFHLTLKLHREARRHAGKCHGRMAKAATDPALRTALEERHDGSEAEHEAIDGIFAVLGRKPHGESCAVTDGHVEAVKHLLNEFDGSPALDPALAAAGAALEGHAVGRLGALRSWAGQLGLADALPALERLQAEARRAAEGFAALGTAVEIPAATGADLTLKRAALIGLR